MPSSLAAAVDVLTELELQFAKARFAQDYDCVAVKLLERRCAGSDALFCAMRAIRCWSAT